MIETLILQVLVPVLKESLTLLITGLVTMAVYHFNSYMKNKALSIKNNAAVQEAVGAIQIDQERLRIIKQVVGEAVDSIEQKAHAAVKKGDPMSSTKKKYDAMALSQNILNSMESVPTPIPTVLNDLIESAVRTRTNN